MIEPASDMGDYSVESSGNEPTKGSTNLEPMQDRGEPVQREERPSSFPEPKTSNRNVEVRSRPSNLGEELTHQVPEQQPEAPERPAAGPSQLEPQGEKQPPASEAAVKSNLKRAPEEQPPLGAQPKAVGSGPEVSPVTSAALEADEARVAALDQIANSGARQESGV